MARLRVVRHDCGGGYGGRELGPVEGSAISESTPTGSGCRVCWTKFKETNVDGENKQLVKSGWT